MEACNAPRDESFREKSDMGHNPSASWKEDNKNKWVFTIKYKLNDSIEHYKAHLVAKGYTQTYVIDYSKTFAHVTKMNTIRMLIALVVTQN